MFNALVDLGIVFFVIGFVGFAWQILFGEVEL
jgi:preprotein translocase subunit Sss1